jgi:hypothetical protein
MSPGTATVSYDDLFTSHMSDEALVTLSASADASLDTSSAH